MKTKLLITGVAIFAITSLGFSQNANPRDTQGRGQGTQSAFVDDNNDGVCDNYENGSPGQRQVDGRGNGMHQGMNQGRQGQGMKGKGMMKGQNKGGNFVDADKDGVCDNAGNDQARAGRKK